MPYTSNQISRVLDQISRAEALMTNPKLPPSMVPKLERVIHGLKILLQQRTADDH